MSEILTVIAFIAVLGACVYEWWQMITDQDLHGAR